ncbi:DUF7344 domain-containing protein [Natronorubrum daqingense]|uniref:DUF7344 domain-containing protein n=1 Tax=Natronorubrum daqingense TaxID=588898 RepID=A0A1N6XA92_9EURY|nr:hypothetical protein [Natronorubrum daqingense]APX96003.1 hypothetical protein BB347_04865 [Natronorubrum daqingense]SIQ99268.1 hypothetical protein SAMN05421809_0058 [Natronorubrum daqingense]
MSNSDVAGRSTRSRDVVFGVLTNGTRRRLLQIIRDRSPTGISKRALARELATVPTDAEPATVTDAELERTLTECHHSHLPYLLDSGLVVETDADTVAAGDHWAFDDPVVRTLLDSQMDSNVVETLANILTDPQRRTVLSVLANYQKPVSTDTLARDVTAREMRDTEAIDFQERLDYVLTALVHDHLPRLQQAGLVGTGDRRDVISYEGGSRLRDTLVTTTSPSEPVVS